jgi:hypothetical protein
LPRRAARMARPARVRIRNRKPWVFARRRLLGWKVRLLTQGLQAGSGLTSAVGHHRTPEHPRAQTCGSSRRPLDRPTVRGGSAGGQTRGGDGGLFGPSPMATSRLHSVINPTVVRAATPTPANFSRSADDFAIGCGQPLDGAGQPLLASPAAGPSPAVPTLGSSQAPSRCRAELRFLLPVSRPGGRSAGRYVPNCGRRCGRPVASRQVARLAGMAVEHAHGKGQTSG